MNSAQLCRDRNWQPGTMLVGDEGFGPTVIVITAIGEETLLARGISHNGKPSNGHECPWTLAFRDWKKLED